jgi:hypothetical protein
MDSLSRKRIRVHDVRPKTREAASELRKAVAQQLQLLQLLWRHVERRHGCRVTCSNVSISG